MSRERLDLALVKHGLAPSREQAKRLIMAGEVSVMGRRVTQPGTWVKEHEQIVVRQPAKFVSRGGLKMEGALNHFGIDVSGALAGKSGGRGMTRSLTSNDVQQLVSGGAGAPGSWRPAASAAARMGGLLSAASFSHQSRKSAAAVGAAASLAVRFSGARLVRSRTASIDSNS